MMKKIGRFLKRGAGLVGGILSGGGSLLAGFDPTTAFIFAGCTIAIITGVEFATVKELKELFDDDH